MGSRLKKAVVSENVRESLSKWKRRVKEKQGSSVALRESQSTSSLDSMGTDINKKAYSFASSSTGQRTPTESWIHESSSSSPRSKKLKVPLSFYLEDYSSNHDMNAHNNDDKSDVEDEIRLIEP